jgi:non-lysosomal glucosylceramidase
MNPIPTSIESDLCFKQKGIDAPAPFGSSNMERRDFLKYTGLGLLSCSILGRMRCASAQQAGLSSDHFVPLDKKLDPAWIQSLFARGQRTVYSGDDLKTIAMPVGGLCAGQLYLTGDGRLAAWHIFNQHVFTGYGRTNYNLGIEPDVALDQGFAIGVWGGDKTVRTLDSKGFEDVRFTGEYPIAVVEYRDRGIGVNVTLEAFSPFIPLNAEDSALPATILRYTVKNTSGTKVAATISGWLDNQVNRFSGQELSGLRYNEIQVAKGATTMQCRAKSADIEPVKREPIVFADFEGDSYGAWQAEGKAFGRGPAAGTLEKQQRVSGFTGKGLVNTFLGGDDQLHGKLTSPVFTVERDFINLLVGGGGHTGKTCVNLVVAGQIVQTAKGNNVETLTWRNWNVRAWAGKRAHIEIIDGESGGWGHINVDQIEFSDGPKVGYAGKVEDQSDYGTMALTVLGDKDIVFNPSLTDGGGAQVLFGRRGLERSEPYEKPFGQPVRGAVGKTVHLEPGQEETIVFVVSWCFANRQRDNRSVGNYYANRFSDAARVAQYIATNQARLVRDTTLWHQTWYDATLPYWFLDRMGSTLSTLATETCQWWKNGRFWAWEGVGCCHGTCAHVWNYEHAMARLFPRLERSVREMQDYAPGVGLDAESGLVRFRGEGWGIWAADSQGGGIMKAYREHQMSTDSAFLQRNYAQIKKALQFLIKEDGNEDGLLEGKQHNTFDIDFYGPNPMIVSLYLGALRAGEEMALEQGDKAFADRCRRIFAVGRRQFVDKLYNGEYFIQIVDHVKHPDAQYGKGCLSDQLFGQGWAHQVGLGYITPRAYSESTLKAIWKYNWAPDVGPQNEAHAPERWFARPGEAGLFTCTWPKSKHMGKKSVRYRNEVWTGIEYQVAGHMAWEGMAMEALAMVKAIHERYHPGKHNPFNEVECGDHYARGMASWGVFLGLCAYEYHGPKGRIGFNPGINTDNFRSAFTTAEGWGTLWQKRSAGKQTNGIDVKWGTVRLNTVCLGLGENADSVGVSVTVNSKPIDSVMKRDGHKVTIELKEAAVMHAKESLQVHFL